MDLVQHTEALIQAIRYDGWDAMLQDAEKYCDKMSIVVPVMLDRYVGRRCPRRNAEEQAICITTKWEIYMKPLMYN